MYTTEIALNGFSIVGNARSNAPANKGGQLFIHDGEAVFEADDVIVFQVENVTEDGVLTDESMITGIIVYDSALDYFNETPLYSYSGMADIDFGRRTMGDRYLEFDASGLTSTDPEAPELEELTVVAGVDILGALDNQKGPLKIPTIEDIDTDGDGIITPDEQGDGAFNGNFGNEIVICFAKGTLIDTPRGPVFVETLRPGDLVRTLDHGPQPIRWIGTRRCAGTGARAPVRIKAGALGNLRTLYVSQNHRMLVAGPAAELLFGQAEVLVAAKHLVNDDSIRIVPRGEVDYVHFLFDDHQIVFAEGCPAESLYPGSQTLSAVADDSRDEIIALFPELEHASSDTPLSRYTLRKHEARALRTIA